MKRRKPGGSFASSVGGADLEARRSQRLKTTARLASGRTPLQVVAIAEESVTVAEDALHTALTTDPPRRPSACREGCAFCCQQTVGTAAPEVLRIVAYLQQTQTLEQLKATQQCVRERTEQRRVLRPDQRGRARLPCPLLVENRCIAYPVRPLTCRGFNSADAAACERAVDTSNASAVPSYAPQRRLCTFVLDGMRAGLQEAQLDGELLELAAALDIALSLSDAAERWLAGEAVFAAARLA